MNSKIFKLSDVKHRLKKVAFDIVKFTDDDNDANLWQVQKADDGEYIVALYEGDGILKESEWKVELNKFGTCVYFYYKNYPIATLPSDKISNDVKFLKEAVASLPIKLSKNTNLVKSLLKELPESTKKIVLSKYPELN